MYWKRWLTALIILPPLVLLIFKSSQLFFTIATIAVATVCLWEYYRIVYKEADPPVGLIFYSWGYFSGTLLIFFAYYQNYFAMMITIFLNFIGVAILSIFRFKVNPDAPIVVVKHIFGTVYIPLTISFIVLLRSTTNGPLWVFFLFWVVAWGDTGALYIGSMVGHKKLCEAVSPNKTIEGALGGLAANFVFAWFLKLLLFPSMTFLTCTAFALSIGVAGQIGDLFESEFKRAAGVKDSSSLIPGHGGFLDRLDAMLFAAPVAYLLKEYLLL